MKKIILFSILVLVLSGCNEPPAQAGEIPADFAVEYTSSAMHIEWGSTEISMNYSGEAHIQKTMGIEMEIEEEFTVPKEDLQEIYAAVVQNNFFSLNGSYDDPSVMDGGTETLKITANDSSKTVRVTNTYVEKFEAVSSKIYSAVQSNITNYPLDFRDYCDSKKIECNSKCDAGMKCGFVPGCDEWAEYCQWGDSEDIQSTTLTPAYCDKLENREDCIEQCSSYGCSQDICDALVFEAPECTECSPGCCEQCNDLDSCFFTNGCAVAWVHPSGESIEYGGCFNMDLCSSPEALCDYINFSIQGLRHEASMLGDSAMQEIYSGFADELEVGYNEEC